MTWLRKLLAKLRIADDAQRAAQHQRTIRKADRVISDYGRQDWALRVEVRKR